MTLDPDARALRARVGRCSDCRYVRRIVSARGSEFWLCRRSEHEPARYPRYPRHPVVDCAGWEPPPEPG